MLRNSGDARSRTHDRSFAKTVLISFGILRSGMKVTASWRS